MQDSWQRPGIGGIFHLLNCYDVPTGFGASCPAIDQDTSSTKGAMGLFFGAVVEVAVLICFDNHKVVSEVCREHSITRRLAHSGGHQSDGVIGQPNRRIQGRTRTHLRVAGLPCCFWPHAAQHWCSPL